MNKKDINSLVAEKGGISKEKAREVVESLLAAMVNELDKGKPVMIQDFGSFSVRERKARIGRNPQNGQPINIPARKVVAFRAGKGLLEKIN